MPDYWEPGTQYDYGAVVLYEGLFHPPFSLLPLMIQSIPIGVQYKIIQPHRSQVITTSVAHLQTHQRTRVIE